MSAASFLDLVATATRIADVLRHQGASIAVSESAAGGLINAALVAVPGASDFYRGGMIVYTGAGRRILAGNEALPEGLKGATEAFALVQANRSKNLYLSLIHI